MGPSGGSEDNYCLRLNDYEKKYAESFRSLRDDESFADVTLIAGVPEEDEEGEGDGSSSQSFKAHRVILSACSSYFHSLLVKTLSPWISHPVLLLTDVKSRDLHSLLDFIYFGQVHVNNEALPSFLSVAQRLRIKGLCETPYQIQGRRPEPLYVSPSKRPKFGPSILRNHLQIHETSHHEVKNEPIATILSTPSSSNSAGTEDVPSSAVTEFITTNDGDLIPSLAGHGFMFTSDPSPTQQQGQPQQQTITTSAPPPAAMVTIDDKSVKMEEAHHIHTLQPAHTHHLHHHHHHSSNSSQAPRQAEEPQDLTPTTHAPTVHHQTASTEVSEISANNEGTTVVGSSPTPPKKDRNSRKTCGYCHKDFHEMSLKRHIKDVHFRNQNTFVICPHCCKQYASQNSLYSHLNRVHGMKKELMESIHLQVVTGNAGGGTTTAPAVSAAAAAVAGNNSASEGIMDLAHHSDSSNG